ncbi:MAG: conjugative transfer signal peptidase TraF [Rhodospirillaceae bacterium]|nr:conjugative transfer signal peptidase TraF [Rhodospirillaceae bacterium]
MHGSIKISLVFLTIYGATQIAAATYRPAEFRLYWNPTPSVPVGLYWRTDSAYTRGDLVVARPPAAARDLAAARGILPKTMPLLKRVAATEGDEICASGTTISVNGKALAERLVTDSKGRAMPAWDGCHRLGDEVFLLLPEVPGSFDGRYFGAIPRASVIGKAIPLWTH